MPYVVTWKPPKGREPSLDQFLAGTVSDAPHRKRTYPGTVTRFYHTLPQGLYTQQDIDRLRGKLSALPYVSQQKLDARRQYKVYSIPKKSGGARTICEPCQALYQNQVALRTLFERDFSALWHTTAFAYCKGRSIRHCVARHQANQSCWFLRLDFENFFGNTRKDFVLRQMEKIAPFSEVMRTADGRKLMSEAIDICFLDGGLPQGTPISPMLTNLVMIPFDHALNKRLHKRGFVYTRYADDIQISHRNHFNPQRVIRIVEQVLREEGMPYRIKREKTRFGSSSGRNWNLGLMLNRENQITIGHEEHKRMKARIHSFVMDEKNGKPWSFEDVQRLAGQLAYYRSIEPYAANRMIAKLELKLGVSVEDAIQSACARQRWLNKIENTLRSIV